MKCFWRNKLFFIFLVVFVNLHVSCQEEDLDEEVVAERKAEENEDNAAEEKKWKTIQVKASAYNSIEAQTKKGNVGLAAWGDMLKPGMKAIAVSRDLIKKGLTHNTKVKIEGLDGIYVVKDKMHSRWRNKIDIYMGVDVKKARKWGIKKLNISYLPKEKE